MDRRKIARQLGRYLLWIFLISSLLAGCVLLIWYSGMDSSLESNQIRFLITCMGLLWILPLTVSSLAIFLNLYPKVRHSWVYSAGSFFLLPLMSTFVGYKALDPTFIELILYPFLSVTLIYFLVLIYFFIQFFRQHNHKVI